MSCVQMMQWAYLFYVLKAAVAHVCLKLKTDSTTIAHSLFCSDSQFESSLCEEILDVH